MKKIEFYQQFVIQLAGKLNLEVNPKVQWSRYTGCKPEKGAHAHLGENDPNYGLICITHRGLNIGGWEWGLAHEVAHFIVEDHRSQEFARIMVKLGYATPTEKAYADGLLKREELRDHSCLVNLDFRYWICKKCGFSMSPPVSQRRRQYRPLANLSV